MTRAITTNTVTSAASLTGGVLCAPMASVAGRWGVPGAASGVARLLAVLLVCLVPSSAWAGGCVASWVPGIGTQGVSGGNVNAVAVLPGGDVLVGGAFTSAGSLPVNNIARVNPSTGVWSALGAGTNSIVNALAVLPGGDVIVGGAFSSAGGVAVSNIARFNPSTGVWSALGSGITSSFGVVRALVVLPGGNVVVAGDFSSAGGVPASRIARVNPSTGVWSALGAGTDDTVRVLAVLPGGDVLVGGFFTSAGGVAANRIARLNPSTGAWSALGSGTNSAVYALAVLPGGDVIVGGNFTNAGDVGGTRRIARLNPSTSAWSVLGAETNNDVNALAVLPGGDVIAGGAFSTAGGVGANRIARLNPNTSQWSALESGTNFSVFAISLLPGGDVIVGGAFTTAGGLAASRIARYQPGAPTPSFVLQPLSQVASISGTIQFGVAAVESSGGTPSYAWRRNGVPISTVTNPSASTPVLTLSNVQAADVASYDCIIANSCGNVAVLSNAATLTLAGTPASNACAGAATIGNGTFTFSTVGATTDGPVENTIGFGSGDFQVNQDVWFTYTATCSGTVTVNMCASGFDTKVAIYNGTTCPTAPNTAIAGNDDSAVCNPNGLRSFATFSATAGNRYLVRVGGFTTSVGAVSMTISCTSSPCGPSDIAGANQSIGADGQLTADDIIVFLGRYFNGCQ